MRPAIRFAAPVAVALAACLLSVAGAAAERRPVVLDTAYGETLYAYYQRQYFDAISRLLLAQDRQELPRQGDDGELLLGSLYVQYGIPDAAAPIFTRRLAGDGASPQAARIWQALAELDYRRERFAEAIAILESHFVRGEASEEITVLAVKTLMRLGRYADAVAWLGNRTSALPESRYLRFNLAVALVGAGQEDAGAAQLALLQELEAADEEMRALRDRVSLALAATRIRQQRHDEALAALAPAQLDGPYSNEALLLYGIASHRAGKQGRAVSALGRLVDRSPHEQAVQESWIALGQAHEARGDAKLALSTYQQALTRLDAELKYLDARQATIDRGEWFAVLEKRTGDIVLRDDRGSQADSDVLGLALHYRQFAGHRFVLTFAQYVEVSRLARVAGEWRARIPVLSWLVDSRESRHRRLAGEARQLLAETEPDAFAAHQVSLATRVDDAITRRDPLEWAGPRERKLADDVALVESLMARWPERDWSRARERLSLLRGALAWEAERARPARAWTLRRAVRENARLLDQSRLLRARVTGAAAREPASVAGWQQRLETEDREIARLADASSTLRARLRRQMEDDARETIRADRERIVQLAAEAYYAIGQIGHAAWRGKREQAREQAREREKPANGIDAGGQRVSPDGGIKSAE